MTSPGHSSSTKHLRFITKRSELLGPQPPVPDRPPQDAENRSQLVSRRFINVFAQPEHPLAVLLDDLQWLDAATLDKAVELKVSFYPPHLKGWSWVRWIGKVDQG
jgi:hypothetical protein